jgi:hypothetical protein
MPRSLVRGIEQPAGGGGAASLTVEEVDGAPSFTSISTLRFDQVDGFAISQPGAGIARIDFSGGAATDQDARVLAYLALMGF